MHARDTRALPYDRDCAHRGPGNGEFASITLEAEMTSPSADATHLRCSERPSGLAGTVENGAKLSDRATCIDVLPSSAQGLQSRRWRGKCSGWNARVGARETGSPGEGAEGALRVAQIPMAKSRVTMAARIGAADTERKYKNRC